MDEAGHIGGTVKLSQLPVLFCYTVRQQLSPQSSFLLQRARMNPSSAVASYQEFGHSNMKKNKRLRDSREGGMPTAQKERSVEKKGRECNTEL